MSSELGFSAASDEGLRTCLRVGVEGGWATPAAAEAGEAIASELRRRFGTVFVCTRSGSGIPGAGIAGAEALGQLWLQVRQYAATFAGYERAWAAVSREASNLAAKELASRWPTVDHDVLGYVEAEAPWAGALPDRDAGLQVDFEESPALSQIVDALVCEGADRGWARAAVAGVAEVAWRHSRWHRHKNARRCAEHGTLADVGVSPRSARLLMDLLVGRQTVDEGEPLLERLALRDGRVGAEDRQRLRAVVEASPRARRVAVAS